MLSRSEEYEQLSDDQAAYSHLLGTLADKQHRAATHPGIRTRVTGDRLG